MIMNHRIGTKYPPPYCLARLVYTEVHVALEEPLRIEFPFVVSDVKYSHLPLVEHYAYPQHASSAH